MKIDGKTTTKKGRVVYNRKPHYFTQRDAARVTRQALNFIPWDSRYWVSMNAYALTYLPRFLDYAAKHNFFPMETMFYWEWEKPPNQLMADYITREIAGYIGVPEELTDVAIKIGEAILYSQWMPALKLKPGYAQLIVDACRNAGTIREEDIYGRKR